MYKLHAVMMFIVSIIYNTIYWIFHIHQLKEVHSIMISEQKRLRTKEDVRFIMRSFTWTSDGFIDWQPWIITMFNRQLKDDCDGAATLGKWALGKIGIPSRIVRLWKRGAVSGHSVCVSNDNTIMISNNDFVKLDENDFPQSVYDYFGNHYNLMT
jgi:hypothetical protein